MLTTLGPGLAPPGAGTGVEMMGRTDPGRVFLAEAPPCKIECIGSVIIKTYDTHAIPGMDTAATGVAKGVEMLGRTEPGHTFVLSLHSAK